MPANPSSTPPESERPRPQSGFKPAPILYLASVLGLAWGQVLMFTERPAAGLAVTLASLLPAAAAMLGNARLLRAAATVRTRAEAFAAAVKSLDRRLAKPRPGTEAPAPASARGGEPLAGPAPSVPRGAAGFVAALTRPAAGIEIRLPKAALYALGGILLAGAQPFLLMEKFSLGFLLALPGLILLIVAMLRKEPWLPLGRLDQLLQGVLLGLPGIFFITIGSLALWKYVQLDYRQELFGLACNAVGVFLLLALLPKHMPDPEADGGDPLEIPAGAVRWPQAWWFKAACVAAGLVLFSLCGQAARGHESLRALLLGLAGAGVIVFSFPWQRTAGAPRTAAGEPGALGLWGARLGRLLALGLALYLGLRAQNLFAAEKLLPAVYHFLAAGLALVVAFREPRDARVDALREKPLKGYWEALALLALLGAALWLREVHIEQIPFGIEGDEAAAIINAREIINGSLYSVIAHFAGQPIFYLGPLKLAHQVLGLSNFGIKFMAMFYGLLDILTLYLLGRLFLGPRVALATAALMTFSRWHIHFSRFGYGNTLLILTLTLGFYFLLRALRSRRKWDFVFSGMAMSLALQTEVAARLVPVICFAILAFLAVTQRRFLARNWRPLLALLLGAWLTGSAICLLYARSSTALMGRAASVSIFSNDPNAPRDVAGGIIDSIKTSMTMLNWHGDYRSRHNGGMVGEPMLDVWSGLLFALGFLYSLFYWKRLRYFTLFMWFFGFMSASVFAIEAPQAHRAFGIMPTVFLFAGVFLDRSRRLLTETFGRPGGLAAGAAVLALLVPIGTINYHKYFDTLPAFDSNCCEHAKYLTRLGPDWNHFIMTAYLWQGHPPFMAFAPDVQGRFFYSAADVVPMIVPTDKNVCWSFVFEYGDLLPTIQYFYPRGEYHEEIHPKYGRQFSTWEVKREDVMATRGLTARYTPDGGGRTVVRKDGTLNQTFTRETWPLAGPGTVAWEGTLVVPHRGSYFLTLSADEEAEVVLGDGHVLRARDGRETQLKVVLAGGMHRLRARARHAGGRGAVRLSWSCATVSPYTLFKDNHGQAFPLEPVPDHFFFTYPEPKGLLETYYSSADWTGDPVFQQVQPALLFNFMNSPYGLSYPCSADYQGWLTAEREGEYVFAVETPGYAEVILDGRLVVKQGAAPAGHVQTAAPQNALRLSAGRHRVTVRWTVQNGPNFKFWWTPPGGARAIVPAAALSPVED